LRKWIVDAVDQHLRRVRREFYTKFLGDDRGKGRSLTNLPIPPFATDRSTPFTWNTFFAKSTPARISFTAPPPLGWPVDDTSSPMAEERAEEANRLFSWRWSFPPDRFTPSLA